MAQQQMGKPGMTRLLEQWWVRVVLTVIIVLLLVALVLRLQGRQEMPVSEVPAPELSVAERNSDAAPEPAPTPEQPVSGAAQSWPVQPLPESPQVDTQVLDTPDDSDKERVVIEDRVVKRLLQREQDPTTGRSLVPDRPSAEPQRSEAVNASAMSLLSEMAPERYTLQLRAGRNLAVLDELVLKHTLTPAWIYPKAIDDKPWFVLVFGNFDSAEQARRAVSVLPFELQSARPWPKTFGQVQKEAQP